MQKSITILEHRFAEHDKETELTLGLRSVHTEGKFFPRN